MKKAAKKAAKAVKKKPLVFKVGKWYAEKSGKQFKIQSVNNPGAFPIHGVSRHGMELDYTRNGQFFSDHKHNWDLIREVKRPTPEPKTKETK